MVGNQLIASALLLAALAHPSTAQRPRLVRATELDRLRGDSARPITRVARGGSDTISSRVDSLTLEPGQLLAVRVPETASPPRGASPSLQVLPFRFLTTDRRSDLLFVRPVVQADRLEYDGASRAFTGALYVGLEDTLDRTGSRSLSGSVAFLISGAGVHADPSGLTIDHTNLPYVLVRLATQESGESLLVHVRATFNPEGIDIAVPLAHPAITLAAVSGRVTGWGLGVSVVHVALPLEAGSEARVVRLSAGHATPEPAELTLVGGETRDVRIRSVGIRSDTLVAESPPFRSDQLVLAYVWPIRLVLTAVLGALLGIGLSRVGPKQRRPTEPWGHHLAAGLASGTFVAVAFAVGLNLTGLKIATQYGDAVIVLVAALGAMFGLVGIGRVVPAIGRGLGKSG